MKFFALVLATATLMLTTSAKKVKIDQQKIKDVAEVAGGFLMGALDQEFPNIEHCIEDGEEIFTNFENAYHHLIKKDKKDILLGLQDIGKALTELKTTLADCKEIKADLAKLKEIAAEFSNPKNAIIHIGKDIIIHGRDMLQPSAVRLTAIGQAA